MKANVNDKYWETLRHVVAPGGASPSTSLTEDPVEIDWDAVGGSRGQDTPAQGAPPLPPPQTRPPAENAIPLIAPPRSLSWRQARRQPILCSCIPGRRQLRAVTLFGMHPLMVVVATVLFASVAGWSHGLESAVVVVAVVAAALGLLELLLPNIRCRDCDARSRPATRAERKVVNHQRVLSTGVLSVGVLVAMHLAPQLPAVSIDFEEFSFSEDSTEDAKVVAARATGRVLSAQDVVETGGTIAHLVDRQLKRFIEEAKEAGALGVYAIDIEPAAGAKISAPALAVHLPEVEEHRAALLELCQARGGRPCEEQGQLYFVIGKLRD